VASIYSGGGNGVDNACDACGPQCGDSVCSCYFYDLHVYDVF